MAGVFCVLIPADQAGAAEPSEFDQYLIELINRARENPEAEAARLGIDLNEGLPPGHIDSGARQPLAVNPQVMDAASDYAQALIDNDSLDHTTGGSTLSSRLADAGYDLTPSPAGGGQSVGAQVSDTLVTIDQPTIEALFVDWLVSSDSPFRADRITMFNPNDKEIGVGLLADSNYTYYGAAEPFAVVGVLDYTYRNDDAFITGVAFEDLDGDDFYTPGTGEALGSVPVQVYDSVTKLLVASGQTFASGGYRFQLPDGSYDLVFDAPGGEGIYNDIELAGLNLKIDHIAVPEPSAALWLLATGAVAALRRRRLA